MQNVENIPEYMAVKDTLIVRKHLSVLDPRLDLTGQAFARHRLQRHLFDHQEHTMDDGHLSRH